MKMTSNRPPPKKYECKLGEQCKTCTTPCMYMFGRCQMGRVYHPPLRMPMPNLIRKVKNQLDDETIGRIWRNLKWKEIPGLEDTDQK